MPPSIDTLDINALSVGERLDLIERLWDSLSESPAPADIPAWHLTELEKRRADAATNPGTGTPWRDVLDRLDNGRP